MKMFTRRLMHNFKHYVPEFKDIPINYMEIGVFLGDTFDHIIDTVLTHPDSRGYGIDPWVWFTPMHRRFKTQAEWQIKVLDKIEGLKKKHEGKAEFIKGFSQEVLMEPRWKKESFDLIYIDGHHSILSVLRDFVLTWPLLKTNGVMIFDDYLQGNNEQVKVAVDTIIRGLWKKGVPGSRRGSKIDILFKNYQVGMRKLSE